MLHPIEINQDNLFIKQLPVKHIDSPNVKPGVNECNSIVVTNSGKSFLKFSELVAGLAATDNKRGVHLIIGRDEHQIVQMNNFRSILNHGKGDIATSINIVFFNYGKLHCSKNLHFNCFKQKESDIYVHNGVPWHAYSKYQIHAALRLTTLFKQHYNSTLIVADSKSAGGASPTPQFPFVELNRILGGV